jgi:16S rRNA (uracil1498-N3)-methyltransferase
MRASWDPQLSVQEQYSITGDRYHHLVHVIRLEAGEKILLLNGKGLKVIALVEAISKKEIHLKHISSELSKNSSIIDLALGLPKKEALELSLKQATELGLQRIFLVRSKYSQIRIPDAARLEQILVSALEQSNSAWLPEVIEKEWCDIPWDEFDHVLMMDSQSEKRQKNDRKNFKKSLLLVGPEGGFSPEEMTYLHAKPRLEVLRLPTPIMRTPTAVATGAGILLGRLLD